MANILVDAVPKQIRKELAASIARLLTIVGKLAPKIPRQFISSIRASEDLRNRVKVGWDGSRYRMSLWFM